MVATGTCLFFYGLKQGLFTADGPDCAGDLAFDGLGVPAQVYASSVLSARRLDWSKQSTHLAPRRRNSHKGHFGHVLVIAGTLSGRRMRWLMEACDEAELVLKIIPPVEDLFNGDRRIPLRDLEIGDLLRRAPIELDGEAIEGRLRGRRVLVTGAGGSIGSVSTDPPDSTATRSYTQPVENATIRASRYRRAALAGISVLKAHVRDGSSVVPNFIPAM